MRIGYVVKRYPRYSETFIRNEIAAHEAAGWEIDVFSLRVPSPAETQPLMTPLRAKVTFLPSSKIKVRKRQAEALDRLAVEFGSSLPALTEGLQGWREERPRDLLQAVWLARHAREGGLEHLHAHFATLPTTVTRLAAHFAGISYSFTAHAKDIFHETVRAQDLYRKIRSAAAVVTVSDYNVNFLYNDYGADSGDIYRIYNGLDLTLFPFSKPDLRPPLIVAVGRLVEKKGFSDLLAACAALKKRGQSFQCRIVGSGKLEDCLLNQIRSLDLENQVELLGVRSQTEVIALIQQAAVLAVPCRLSSDGDRDGLPTVLLEAMALGTPCVSTSTTGIPELLKDQETGLLVPPGNPTALARALERLLLDAPLRVRLAERARKVAERNHDIHLNGVRLREIFKKAITSYAGASAGNGASTVVFN